MMMWSYFRLLLLKSEDEIGELQALHPMESKKSLARELTALFFGDETAKRIGVFWRRFFQRVKPRGNEDLQAQRIVFDPESMTLLNIMTETGMFDSKGQIRRLFQQGAIKLNGERKENCEERLNELSLRRKS